jgi:hypothetical protein
VSCVVAVLLPVRVLAAGDAAHLRVARAEARVHVDAERVVQQAVLALEGEAEREDAVVVVVVAVLFGDVADATDVERSLELEAQVAPHELRPDVGRGLTRIAAHQPLERRAGRPRCENDVLGGEPLRAVQEVDARVQHPVTVGEALFLLFLAQAVRRQERELADVVRAREVERHGAQAG